jgi:hypothetical protein
MTLYIDKIWILVIGKRYLLTFMNLFYVIYLLESLFVTIIQ